MKGTCEQNEYKKNLETNFMVSANRTKTNRTSCEEMGGKYETITGTWHYAWQEEEEEEEDEEEEEEQQQQQQQQQQQGGGGDLVLITDTLCKVYFVQKLTASRHRYKHLNVEVSFQQMWIFFWGSRSPDFSVCNYSVTANLLFFSGHLSLSVQHSRRWCFAPVTGQYHNYKLVL